MCMTRPLHVCVIDMLWVQIQVNAEIQYANLDNKSSYKIVARDRSGENSLENVYPLLSSHSISGFSKHFGSEGWRTMGKDY